MIIDKDTKVIARLHTVDNGTGLNIYNQYFENLGINAVYLLFKNANPEPLIYCMKNLNIRGAITAGFEHDPNLQKLLDDCSDAVKVSGRVAMIANRNGKLWGHYQAGEGLMYAIQQKINISGKSIVIVGAGAVAKTLLISLGKCSHKPNKVIVFNRTTENAKFLESITDLKVKAFGLNEFNGADGDILVNASRIGSKIEDVYFKEPIIKKFKCVADVTFGNENTNLISIAAKNNLITVSGWNMFTYQAAVVIKEILGHEADIEKLDYFVRQGLTAVNHGAKLN